MQTQLDSTREGLSGSWALAGALGHFIAIGTSALFWQVLAARASSGMAPGASAVVYTVIGSALVGGAAGVAVGAAQWPRLRGALSRLRARQWLLASALGGVLVGVLAGGTELSGPYDASSCSTVLFAASMFGLVVGGIFGGAQAWALRRQPDLARRWCLATAFGWAIGSLIAVAGVLGAILGLDVPAVTMVTAAVSIAVLGAIVAWTTDLALGIGSCRRGGRLKRR
jgi:hypothetical protein